MTLNTQKRDHRIYYALAFSLPFLGYLLIALLSWAAPFTKTSAFLISDSYYQYYPFFTGFRRALLSGESLLYNWDVGMGMDYLGLMSYYLASPLNWLLVLVPESWTLELYFLLVPIRLGLAGMFFAIFLKNIFHKADASIAMFGAMYGTCAWALGYLWNVMWLDGFALLPLVALGMVSLLRDKKFILYTLSLFLAVYSNYYVGFFVCIFVLLSFIGYQITNFTTFRRFFEDLGRIAVFSLLAIGMTALMSLPALAALSRTKAMADSTVAGKNQSFLTIRPRDFHLNIATWAKYSGANGAYYALKEAWKGGNYGAAWKSFCSMNKFIWAGLSEGLGKVTGNMGGGLEPTSYNGLPNLYCGVGTIFMASLFLTLKGVKVREKLCSLGLLLFLMLSFLLRQLDYIWHGFHFPNQLPYRFSFLFSFVMLYMAYKAYLQRHKLRPWQLAFAAVCTCGIFYCSESRNEKTFLVFNGVFFLLYVGVFCVGLLKRKAPENASREEQKKYLNDLLLQRRVVSVCLCAVIFVEFIMNLLNFSRTYTAYDLVALKYPSMEEDQVAVVEYMKNRESELFYRADVTHSQLYNEGALMDFASTSTFSSSADADTTNFMKAMGLGAQDTWNRYCYETTSPVANLFFNLKYLIHRSYPDFPYMAYFDQVAVSGSVVLLENNAYLPLGFLAEPQLANTKIAPTGERFDLQNQLMRDVAGIDEDVWQRQYGNLIIDHHNVTISSKTASGGCYFSGGQAANRCTQCNQVGEISPCANCGGMMSQEVYITYRYTCQQDGLFAVDLQGHAMENINEVGTFSVSHNGALVRRDTADTLTQLVSLCNVSAGDIVEIKFPCNQGVSGRIHVQAAILDEELFRQAYDLLNTSTLHLTVFKTDYIKGYIDCHKDGLLYTSIPDDGNWAAYVDGKKTDIIVIGDAMVGVPLSQGHHAVEFRYQNSAFSLGWKVSLVCALIFAIAAYLTYKKPSVMGKYEKASKKKSK